MNPIRVALVDDHALVRTGLRRVLESFEGVEVVGEAADGKEAFSLAEEHEPDVVVMDISMPGLNGLDAAARIVRKLPRSRVLVLSMHTDEAYVAMALKVGVKGYIPKDASSTELEFAIRAIARGESYLSPSVTAPLVEDFAQRAREGRDSFDRLTSRQREIVQLIAEGHTTKDIAQRLGLSTKTVEAHRAQLMQRLEIHDVAGLVRWAIRHGLATPEA